MLGNSHVSGVERKVHDMLVTHFLKPKSDETETLISMLDFLFREVDINNYYCPCCFNEMAGNGITKTKMYTYPRVLLIHLDRRLLLKDNNDIELSSTTDLNKGVEYPRYLKLRKKMYYQLLSTVVYVEGKFISYFLHSDKKWYKDDGITKIKEVRAYEACNQRKAFFFIYKKYNDDIKQLADIPEIVDLIMDSYGKNEDNQVAISLQLDVDMINRGKPTDSSKNIIKEYENAKCDNLQRFKGFIQKNQLNLHFWRYHNKKDSNHDLMYVALTMGLLDSK